MQQFSVPIPDLNKLAVASTVTFLACATPALAQTVPAPHVSTLDQVSLTRLAADLAYPNSAQRFFEAGNAQFEEEIRRLTAEDAETEPQLTIKPEVLEQFEDE
ncbi:hypothetical protein N836_01030 [Leptolyngbya sp. Heron Island J]|uniref:hypothetical protein n=1 Tax=Leptolyngbya sp. Heron Island J TaxID=1385935 RepID=UPI0003B9BD99|nr:hypothetical protein [Leptolyngbya sp. Heron Island J]ESA36492.1 hypothetical protein N836_01030 [Leptolyngbya sp. Heron Island J]